MIQEEKLEKVVIEEWRLEDQKFWQFCHWTGLLQEFCCDDPQEVDIGQKEYQFLQTDPS